MIFALIVAGLSLIGAWLPLRARLGHASLQLYLSLAAGALLGAALFHLLPESSEHIGEGFGLPAVLGIGVVFFLQRYLAPHCHEPLPESPTEHAPHPEHEHTCHDHAHGGSLASSMVAVLALSIHSFFDGVAIGAVADSQDQSLLAAVFLSVLIHKPMDGLSVSVLLLNARATRRNLWLTQIFYAALVPIGALAFNLTRGSIAEPSIFVGYTLAFSAGTFLAIALTDLLPELHFHTHDRHKLSAALIAGLVVMWLTSLLGHPSGDGHDHDGEDHTGHGHAKVVALSDERDA